MRMGTSTKSEARKLGYEDHPHAYGDKLSHIFNLSLIPGSSPRVWGQDLELILRENLFRIIPTRMGTR